MQGCVVVTVSYPSPTLQVLGAARLAQRTGRTSAILAHKILQAAAGQRDEAVFVSVYRAFRNELLRWYPKLDTARAQLMKQG